ncbi:uncharacterized protein ATC70_005671 [Mucor velutinosus]|uniref:Uncharacterized protein n=1 Tax=Mucor velutinosus TaxID=708070 RepID=A0AAN7HZK1_9FUNG|nr:hypothetical protein ATC70_005671 [Mucor velutinosus]
MDNFNNSLNVTMQAFQLISEAYTFCYVNLQKSNIPLPAPEQVLSATRTTVSYILSNSPSFIRQLYGMISQMAIESNFMGIFLSLIIMYAFYCLILGMFRWIYRLVYGFVRFSLILAVIGAAVYFAHMYLSSSTTTSEETTKSYS